MEWDISKTKYSSASSHYESTRYPTLQVQYCNTACVVHYVNVDPY